MIELLPDMPKGVTGVRVSGRLGGDELRELKPSIEDMLHTDEIRIVEVIAPDYEGFGPGGLLGSEAGLRHRVATSFGVQTNCGGVRQGVGRSDPACGGVADSRRARRLQAR